VFRRHFFFPAISAFFFELSSAALAELSLVVWGSEVVVVAVQRILGALVWLWGRDRLDRPFFSFARSDEWKECLSVLANIDPVVVITRKVFLLRVGSSHLL
jgi:hypothetical protein